MSARSSRRSVLVGAVVALAACGKHDPNAGKKKGDLARVKVLGAYMVDNVPRPGAAPECGPGDYVGGYPMTHLTLLKIGGKTWKADKPEYTDWINPAGLDAPSARVLIDDKASADEKAYAAAEFQAAKFYVVYRVDNLDAPIALGVKDIKMSTVAARVVKYGANTIPICTSVFLFQNSQDKYEWASAHSDKPLIPPEVSAAVRDDLTARYLELAPSVKAGGAPTPPKR
jgi:hypothetical protein